MELLEDNGESIVYLDENGAEVTYTKNYFIRHAFEEAYIFADLRKLKIALRLPEITSDKKLHDEALDLIAGLPRKNKKGDKILQKERVLKNDIKIWSTIWFFHGTGMPLKGDSNVAGKQESTACGAAAKECGTTYDHAVSVYKRHGSKNCVFRGHPDTHFGMIRPVVSVSSGHPFRCEPDSRFGVVRPPISV